MQGFNMGRYVPPDAEGVLTANQASGKGHALGRRAAKLKTEGALTVRFEMPFAVWCDTCENTPTPTTNAAGTAAEPPKKRPQLIGQGVRFNAEKRRVGSYFSTPIYSFRMRHAACGGALEIRTDPQRTSYEVIAGGRRRDTGGDDRALDDDSLVGTGTAQLLLLQERDSAQQQREAAFSSLEKTIADRAALAAAGARIDALGDVADRQWDDPYARNQALRRAFRVGRRARERDAGVAEEIRARLGFGLELLPESDDDARRARLVEFGTRPPGADAGHAAAGGGVGVDGETSTVLARPLFFGSGGGGGGRVRTKKEEEASAGEERTSSPRGKGRKGRRLKSEVAASRMRDSLVSEIVGNTRLATDPFLEPRSSKEPKSTTLLPGLKRKRNPDEDIGPPAEERPAEKATSMSSALVDYDSD